MRAIRVVLLFALAVIGLAHTHHARAGDDPIVIDDGVLFGRLLYFSDQLIKGRKGTSFSELRGQLDRSECKLDVAEVPTRTLTPERIYAKCLPSVLVVAGVFKCDKCPHLHATITSGFLVTGSGAFVANYHTFEDEKHITLVAMTSDGEVFPVKEVLAASEDDDVAILQLDAPGREFRPLGLAASALAGTSVNLISHPDKRFYTLTRGVVSRYFKYRTEERTITRMHITADFARGSSGGPVLNEYGAVVGLVKHTNSIYFHASDERQIDLQMVLKECVPSSQVLQLISQE